MNFTYIRGSQTAAQIFLPPVDVFKVLLEYIPADSRKDCLSCWHAPVAELSCLDQETSYGPHSLT